jgi:flagellar hook-associated protein FlgK
MPMELSQEKYDGLIEMFVEVKHQGEQLLKLGDDMKSIINNFNNSKDALPDKIGKEVEKQFEKLELKIYNEMKKEDARLVEGMNTKIDANTKAQNDEIKALKRIIFIQTIIMVAAIGERAYQYLTLVHP